MKRFILFSLFLSFFGFNSALAACPYTPVRPYDGNIFETPFSLCNITYDKGIVIYDYNRGDFLHIYWSSTTHNLQFFGYNPGSRDMTIGLSYNYQPPYILASTYGDGQTFGRYTNWPLTHYYLPAGFTWEDACNTIQTSDASIFMTNYATSETCGYHPPSPVNLRISRSPEAGGGVSDYPTGENILCGIDSYEVCEASFPLNTEVTLDASPNEGYAFSHWEINGLAMADVDGSIDVTMSESKDVVAVFKPIFRFPLSGYTSTTASITAVMDHSLSGGFYTADGRNNEIEAFNGLIANGTQHSYGGNIYCYDTTETNPFPGLNYAYGSEVCYDEHPGFDFAVVNETNVLAPFAGKLYWATTDLVNGNPGTFGTFYIDHGNGYTTWFLHCSGLTQDILDQIQQKGYADVSKGDHIAESGNQGSGAYHLHFEVRKDGVDDEHVIDPYGWELWEE